MTEADRDALIGSAYVTMLRADAETMVSLASPDEGWISCPSGVFQIQAGQKFDVLWEGGIKGSKIIAWRFASPSPAQWPEDVVERKALAVASVVTRHFTEMVLGWTEWAHLPKSKRAEIEGGLNSVVVAEVTNALATLPPPACNCEDAQPYKDALSDLLFCHGEQEAIGGGPGWQERDRKAWDAAEELMRSEP